MTEPIWLTPSEQRAWRAYLAVHARMSERLHRDLMARSGLTLSEFDVLVHVSEAADGRIRHTELGRALCWEKSRLSKMVSRMEARGFVSRAACEEDGRGSFVLLTELGRRTIEDAAPAHVALVRHLMFDRLSTEQVDTYYDIHQRVLDALNEG